MRITIIILLAFTAIILFAMCAPATQDSSESQAAPAKQNTCNAKMEIIYEDRNPNLGGSNIYVNVDSFDLSNPDCKSYFETQAYNLQAQYATPYTVHFLDDLPKFVKPKSGMYGGAKVREKVILQYVCFPNDAKRIVSWDLEGKGKYIPVE